MTHTTERGFGTGFIIGVVAVIAIVIAALYLIAPGGPEEEIVENENTGVEDVSMNENDVFVNPISHATFVMDMGGTIIYNDPVGGAEAFEGQPPADVVLVSDIHGDHLHAETLEAVLDEQTVFIAPQAVVDELPEALASRAIVLANGQNTTQAGVRIEAVPMYNLPEQGIDIRHEKGRGNGYVLEKGDKRVYIAGDTAGIPEMRTLQDIDVAFVPMNLPYTMSVEDAADAVIAFAPAIVYPYHYRTPEGLSDVEQFRELVNAANPAIDVALIEWYPEADAEANE